MGAFRNRVLEEHSFLKRTLGGGGSFAIRDRLDPAPAVIASASSSVLHHAGLVRRPQRPGTQRVNASGQPLQQFTLENRWQAPAFRNHGSAQDIPALAVLCLKVWRTATTNLCSVVKNLWRTGILCGKGRKNRGNSGLRRGTFRADVSNSGLPTIGQNRRPDFKGLCWDYNGAHGWP